MKRVIGWEKILAEQIKSAQGMKFQWGVFDCATWACDVVLALTGTDLATDFRGKYSTEEEATQLMNAYAGDIEAVAVKVATAHQLKDVPLKFACRGDIVVIHQNGGKALGIVGSDPRYAYATTERGVTKFPVKYWLRAFSTR